MSKKFRMENDLFFLLAIILHNYCEYYNLELLQEIYLGDFPRKISIFWVFSKTYPYF